HGDDRCGRAPAPDCIKRMPTTQHKKWHRQMEGIIGKPPDPGIGKLSPPVKPGYAINLTHIMHRLPDVDASHRLEKKSFHRSQRQQADTQRVAGKSHPTRYLSLADFPSQTAVGRVYVRRTDDGVHPEIPVDRGAFG